MSSPKSRDLHVAYLGPSKKTQTWVAMKHFLETHIERIETKGRIINTTKLHRPSMRAVIDLLCRGEAGADYAIVCIENNSDGFYSEVAKAIARIAADPSFQNENRIRVIDEYSLRVIPKLFVHKSAAIKDLETLYTQPSVERQCSGLVMALAGLDPLKDTNNKITKVLMSPSSGHAAECAEKDSTGLFLGFESNLSEKSPLVELPVKVIIPDWNSPALTDRDDSDTRFWLLAKERHRSKLDQKADHLKSIAAWKTCYLLFLEKDKAGNLLEALSAFAPSSTSGGGDQSTLAKVASIFPAPHPHPDTKYTFEYVFFLEVEGHHSDANLQAGYKKINQDLRAEGQAEGQETCVFLGSYPNRSLNSVKAKIASVQGADFSTKPAGYWGAGDTTGVRPPVSET